jgi:cell division septum initiation protein DivIVA
METVLEILDRAEGVLRRHLGRLPARERQAIEHEVLGLLQMARAALPRELHQATRLLQEAETTLVKAREEARRIVVDAQTHARSIAETAPGGTPAARGQALVDDARQEAERIRRGADEYAAQVLGRLEGEVDRILSTIRRGLEVLRASGSQGRRGE